MKKHTIYFVPRRRASACYCPKPGWNAEHLDTDDDELAVLVGDRPISRIELYLPRQPRFAAIVNSQVKMVVELAQRKGAEVRVWREDEVVRFGVKRRFTGLDAANITASGLSLVCGTADNEHAIFGKSINDAEEFAVFLREIDRQSRPFDYIENIRDHALRLLDWCIKQVVARGTTSVASGKWGAGKTAVFSDLGLHIGHGIEWRGRKVAKGVVVYVALENSDDVERRVSAWCSYMRDKGHDLSKGAFVVHRGPCCLFDPSGKPTADERKLINDSLEASAHYDMPVAMIVIDTLAMSIAPGDDNLAKDAGIYTAAMQRIASATGANVTALAHPPKSGDSVRGSGALQANVDTVLEVSRDKAGRGTIKAGSKFRIGNPAKVNFGYRLEPRVIGKDEDGENIDVVLAVEATARPEFAVEESAEDEAAMTARDEPADKLEHALRAVEYCVKEIAVATGDKPSEIGVPAGQVFARLNVDRKNAGLPVLKDRTMATRLLGKLVEAGELVKSGDNRRTEYRLAASISVRSTL